MQLINDNSNNYLICTTLLLTSRQPLNLMETFTMCNVLTSKLKLHLHRNFFIYSYIKMNLLFLFFLSFYSFDPYLSYFCVNVLILLSSVLSLVCLVLEITKPLSTLPKVDLSVPNYKPQVQALLIFGLFAKCLL